MKNKIRSGFEIQKDYSILTKRRDQVLVKKNKWTSPFQETTDKKLEKYQDLARELKKL